MPGTMRRWEFTSTKNGLESNVHLNPSAPVPQPKPNEHLVQVLTTALNPMDYKPAEVPIVHLFAFPKPATPGLNFAGRIIIPAKDSPLKAGDLIFGSSAASPITGGALAEHAAVPSSHTIAIPEGLSLSDAASIPMAGTTAWQATHPFIKPGQRVFINGGTGSVGSFAIQMAKSLGAHVTASCSTGNVETCLELGAEDVIDYKKGSVEEQLVEKAREEGEYDLVVDCVGVDHALYWQMHEFTSPNATFVFVGWGPSLGFVGFVLRSFLPGCLGGGRRALKILFAENDMEAVGEIGQKVADGEWKVLIDSTHGMEEVVEAYRRLKTGHAKGKVLVSNAGGLTKGTEAQGF